MSEHPLAKADIKAAQNGIYECELWQREIDRQSACGLDCTEAQARQMHLKKFYQDVLDQYGPLVNPIKGS